MGDATRVLAPDPQPNPAHRALADLEAAGRMLGVVTQNIDGMHQAAGSRRVYRDPRHRPDRRVAARNACDTGVISVPSLWVIGFNGSFMLYSFDRLVPARRRDRSDDGREGFRDGEPADRRSRVARRWRPVVSTHRRRWLLTGADSAATTRTYPAGRHEWWNRQTRQA